MIPKADLKATARARLRDSLVLQSVKTHDLEILLRLSGVEGRIKTKHLAEWSVILDWDPEKRYHPTGQFNEQQARDIVTAATKLLSVL